MHLLEGWVNSGQCIVYGTLQICNCRVCVLRKWQCLCARLIKTLIFACKGARTFPCKIRCTSSSFLAASTWNMLGSDEPKLKYLLPGPGGTIIIPIPIPMPMPPILIPSGPCDAPRATPVPPAGGATGALAQSSKNSAASAYRLSAVKTMPPT